MLLNHSKILFLISMIYGVMLTISSNNWMMMWTGMEIALISFIPMITSESMKSSESSMKLFIIQSISSSMLMMSILMMLILSNKFYMIMMISLIMKAGIAPFQMWMISIVEGLNLNNLFHLLVTLKISPLTIMSYFSNKLQVIAMMTLIAGSIMTLNQSSINKIMAYSSVYNMGYIMSVITDYSMWISYLTIYSMMLKSIMIYMKKMKMSFINQSWNLSYSVTNKMLFWLSMLSLGGMPPSTGFIMKIMIMETMMLNKEFLTILVMVISSLIMMFCYIRMAFSSMMMFSLKMKWNFAIKDMNVIFMLIITTMLMPIMTLIKIIK